ncbi:MAG: histidine triad nucleotide-binding protein [Nitrospiria bacterium]
MSESPKESDCLFCKIVHQEIPSQIEYEDDVAIAFKDLNPQAPHHLLVIPKKHIARLDDFATQDLPEIAHLFSVVVKLAKRHALTESGFRTVINSGAGAGQSVFHLHIHLLGGRPFHWPPG